MTVTIEKRPYGPDSSADEIQAIRARLTPLNQSQFLWEEMPIQSRFSIQLMVEQLQAATVNLPQYDLVVDLRSAVPPSQEVRAALFAALKSFPKMRKCACVTGRNFLMNVAAKFVFSSLSIPVSTHKTMEEGFRELGYVGNP